MVITFERYASAVALKLTEWLGEDGRVDVINAKLMWFSCTHKNNAELKPLKELGIETPKNWYDEKHWFPGEANYAFFLSKENADRIAERVRSESHAELK